MWIVSDSSQLVIGLPSVGHSRLLAVLDNLTFVESDFWPQKNIIAHQQTNVSRKNRDFDTFMENVFFWHRKCVPLTSGGRDSTHPLPPTITRPTLNTRNESLLFSIRSVLLTLRTDKQADNLFFQDSSLRERELCKPISSSIRFVRICSEYNFVKYYSVIDLSVLGIHSHHHCHKWTICCQFKCLSSIYCDSSMRLQWKIKKRKKDVCRA